MKNVIITILVIAVIALAAAFGYIYLNPVENSGNEFLNNANFERPNVNIGKNPNFDVGKPETGQNCKEECDNDCGNDRDDCYDDCEDDYEDICKQADIKLVACNHNCQFIPIPPGPTICWNKCEEEYDKACDNDDLKDCKKDCNDLNSDCSDNCYSHCD